MTLVKVIITASLLLNCILAFSGDEYTLSESNPLFESWRWISFPELNDKGLRCIEEESPESIWFGTGRGLVHYDGLNWIVYASENEVLSAPIYGLHYTGDDKLYVTSPRGICHLSSGKWTTDLIFPETGVLGDEWEILNIEGTERNEIWVGLYFGLIRIVKDKITLYTTSDQIRGIENAFRDVTIVDMQKSFNNVDRFIVFDILEDRNSNLWLALEDGRTISLYNGNHDPFKPSKYALYDETSGMLLSRLPILYQASDGSIYNISQSIRGGINRFDPSTGAWSATALSETFGGDNLNFSICETADGTLWMGSLSRIFSFRKGRWEEYKQPSLPVPPTRILLYPATDGSLWMAGHLSDVVRIEYSTPQWKTYKDLLYQCTTPNGEEWFINSEGKLVYYLQESDSWFTLTEEFPLSDPVRLFVDNSRMLWAIGSHKGNAALAWFSDGRWQMKDFPELCWGFHPNGVLQTRDDNIWFGANADCSEAGWGIVRYSPARDNPSNDLAWEHFRGENICEVAYALGETDDNTLLCGFFKGLYEFNGTTTRALHNELTGDIIKVEAMVPDPVRGVWIGTRSQGVIHYVNDEDWTQYTTEEGLVSNSVASLLVGHDSSLWVATDKGISRFLKGQWTKLALPEFFRVSRGNGALAKGKDNSIWVNLAPIEWYRRVFYNKTFSSSESALVSYRIIPENNPPETRIVSYDKKVFYPGNSLITWQGADYWNATMPENLQYSWRLDDEPWSEFGEDANYYFLSMHRGRHRVLVRARDSFMNVDPTPAEAEFRVRPPVWGQAWFLMLIFASVGTIAFLFTASIRKNRMMEEQNLLMKKNNEDLTRQQTEIKEKSEQIMQLLEKERGNKWMNEGILQMNDIIKTHKDNLEVLARNILNKIIEYLEINSGAILLFYDEISPEGEKGYLKIIASYGIEKERMERRILRTEEGLAGACFREKKTMVLTNVPGNQKIASGLGGAKAAELVLVPLKLHEDIVGIIEISSFRHIDEHKIQLLETVSENIASNIITLRSHQQIEEMYRTSQEQSAKLHEQEEELRQQMEELHATQEESQRREHDLQKKLEQYMKKEKEREQANQKRKK